MSLRFACRQAAIISSQSRTEFAIGFSQKTCLPARAPRIVWSLCRELGVMM